MGYPNANMIAQRARSQDESERRRVKRIAIERSEHGFVILTTFADPNDLTDTGVVGVAEHLTWDEMLGHVAALTIPAKWGGYTQDTLPDIATAALAREGKL